jgi:hypothetical protein
MRALPSLFLLAALAAPVAAQSSSSDVASDTTVMMPMRDGVRLSTVLYRPARGTVASSDRFPVLLLRTPYELGDSTLVRQARWFAEAGYVVALQNIRGRYRSEGRFVKYADVDGPDGYDAVEWLAAQPWSTGAVGMWGRSYAAHSQAMAAMERPPHLKALLINQGGMADGRDHAVRQGGAFELGREMTWAFQEARRETSDSVARRLLEREKVEDWYSAMPLQRGRSPLRHVPEYEDYFFAEWEHADDGPFWARPALRWRTRYATSADVPMLHVGGWYDIFLPGTLMNWAGLSRHHKGPVRAVIGPWVHGGNGRSFAGEVDFGPEAAIPSFDKDFHLRWFDRWLKGIDNGVDRESRLRLFVMGGGDGRKGSAGRMRHGGEWINADTFPLRGTRPVRYYLHGDGSLSTRAPSATEVPLLRYTFDPTHPVPTLGGNVSNRVKDGAYDQRERPDFAGSRAPFLSLRARRDVLVFETAPLAEDLTVIGPVDVVLQVSTTGDDADFTAKLVDVHPPNPDYPDGFDMNITDAVQRLSYRDDSRTRQPVVPGKVYRIVVRLFPTANRFAKGHRIRLDVSSSNFPRFDINSGAAADGSRSRAVRLVDNTVHLATTRASYVVLPLVSVRQN